ncbi:MAG TPA: hypothetical protein VK203_10350 [Nostocaceae cyanobacterium]|nr:hypothetical protein [Nostocaceae cyanobacterium]
MTNSQSGNKNIHFFLPKLKADSEIRSIDEVGEWQAQKNKAFQDVASSLDYSTPRDVSSVSSVPTMWARPLSMEMALHNSKYPIRDQMIVQWRGMLAAIALAEVRGFPLKAQLLELGSLKHEEFARSLLELLPSDRNTLYTLPNKHPWEDTYIFLWAGKPVGMTSPSTIVCPSEQGQWTGLPWWENGKWKSPISEINDLEKSLLWRWLENLRRELANYNGRRDAVNMIGGLIDDFRTDLNADTTPALSLSDDPQFFGIPLNRGVINALNKPIKAPEKPSNVQLIPSPSKGILPDLLIIDYEIANAWNELPQHIWIHGGKTLASLKVEDLRTRKIIWDKVRWIESKDLFLPEFYFINREEALPGAYLPKTTAPLNFEGELITPLVPLNPILLEYLTPEDIIKRVQIQPFNGSEGTQVRIIVDLPLTGLNNGEPPANYRISKEYLLKESNAIAEVPVLEVWPHFRTEGWKSYYAFYYDGEYDEETFQVHFPEAKQSHPFKDGRGSYQMVALEQFPSFISCQTKDRKLLGLILLQTPEENRSTSSWTIGVDFGTSFTNVYVNRTGTAEPLKLENLHLKITDFDREVRLPLLFEYFIPENFIPVDKPLPLSSVLTIRGNTQTSEDKWQSIFDGRIYIPDNTRFKPQEDWIKTNLKWEEPKNLRYNQLFLEHLALHISAIAAKNRVKEIQWSLSYPSAFSRSDRNRYTKTWEDITKALTTKTGIKHNSPQVSNLDYFRSESLAVAQYFADQEEHDLVYTTCIDVGGGTSDISIWEENILVHQCSVLLAGRDLFSQFLEMNPKFMETRFKISPNELRGLKGTVFNPKLDVWLRLNSENWLNSQRAYVADQADFQGLIQLTAIGIAGLYYYVGILLKVLHTEGKYKLDQITPVYLGGNGGRFLHWLAEGGRFDQHSEINELLSRMLSKGAGFEDTEVTTRLSQNLKDEVACGLVLNQTRLQGLKKNAKEILIAGECCEINGRAVSWDSRLELLDHEDKIEEYTISQLEIIPKFLYDFHMALRELSIEGVKPLEGYTRNPDPESNKKLWGDTKRELSKILLEIKGKSDDIRQEPPYILALKALLRVLGKEWASKWSR